MNIGGFSSFLLPAPGIASLKTRDKRKTLPSATKNPFEKGFLDLPKLFNWDGLDTVFFLRVPSCIFVAKNRRWI
jgi:hypothetical protein